MQLEKQLFGIIFFFFSSSFYLLWWCFWLESEEVCDDFGGNCSEIKERIKKTKDEKKAKKAEVVSKQKGQGKTGGNAPKGKGPKLGGGGGKR